MRIIAIVFSLLCSLQANAAVILDDSGTILQNVPVLEWKNKVPLRGMAEDNAMKTRLVLAVRLNMVGRVGKTGRIFLVFPSQTLGLASASWSSHGMFQAGSVSTGQRVLLWAGTVDKMFIQETLFIDVIVDQPGFSGNPQISMNFEWEDI